MVLADTLGIAMLGYTVDDVPHIRLAAEAGVGTMSVDDAQIARV